LHTIPGGFATEPSQYWRYKIFIFFSTLQLLLKNVQISTMIWETVFSTFSVLLEGTPAAVVDPAQIDRSFNNIDNTVL
jgi:hypothetical protein